LQFFNEAIATLHEEPDNQLASSQTYHWFNRFMVKSEGKKILISIDYNWPKMLAACRGVDVGKTYRYVVIKFKRGIEQPRVN